MERVYIRGNKALAAKLGVSTRTVSTWRERGITDDAVVSHYGRVIIYDLDKVLCCLNYNYKRKKH